VKSKAVRELVLYALFVAFTMVLGLTDLGYILLPIGVYMTLMHIPVIIAGISLGVKGGAIVGAFFGLTSLIKGLTAPDAIAAIILGDGAGLGLYNLLLIIMVIFVPRILVGVFSSLIYKGLSKIDKSEIVAMIFAAIVGTLTNTILLLGFLSLFATQQAANVLADGAVNMLFGAIMAIVSLNGMIEAGAAVILCVPIGKAIRIYQKRSNVA